MAAQDLLLFDAAPSLLGESSSSLFDCMDSEQGVDDLLCGSRDFDQASSPAPLQLMRPLTEGKTCIGSSTWEATQSIGFNRQTEPSGPIRCMAHELELQARRLEEDAMLTSERGTCQAVGPSAVYQATTVGPASTGAQSTGAKSFSSVTTMFKVPSKGDLKPKPRKLPSSAATVSLALKNSQGVSAGSGCLQPGAWRGCLKSSWCNRENRHRGLCNSRATIPGVDAYNQPAVLPVEPQQLVAGCAGTVVDQALQTPVDLLTPTPEAHCQLDNDSEPGSCSDLDTYSIYPGSDPPPMVQQQELQPLVPCSSTSSDMGGRLSSLDLSYKLEEQYDPESNEQTVDTNAFVAAAMLCNSGTDYSDDEDEEEDEDEAHDSDDADSICSGSTLSADGQDSMSSELVDSQFEEMYSEGPQASSGGSGGPIRKQRSHGGRCVNAGFPGQACTQCHAQQTPVWRAGPMGPKTLCNACGVRWMKHSKRK